MTANDPIADTLTRIRNAHMRNYTSVNVLHSKIIESIVEILNEEGYISGYKVQEDEKGFKSVSLDLKYREGKPAITFLKRISKPGLRKYVGYKAIPKVLNGIGINILSTPKGIITGKTAKTEKVGGELLCNIY